MTSSKISEVAQRRGPNQVLLQSIMLNAEEDQRILHLQAEKQRVVFPKIQRQKIQPSPKQKDQKRLIQTGVSEKSCCRSPQHWLSGTIIGADI